MTASDGSTATTSAEVGLPVSNDISPKQSPGEIAPSFSAWAVP